jgi:HEAT repeat protein
MRTLLALLWLLPASASAEEEPPPDLPTSAQEQEEIPDMPVVEAPLDPVRELIAQAANPRLPEAIAQRHFNQLVAMGSLALPTAAEVFRDPKATDFEAWVAARALGHLGGDGAVNTLLQGLKAKRIITRLGAVSGLEMLKDARAVGALERALFDQAMTVRDSAADALAAIGDRSSHKALSEALNLPANYLQGQSLFVREHIVAALGEVGSIGGIDALVGVLQDDDPRIALAATRSLTKITGITYRDASVGDDAPPSETEVASWKAWWAHRSAATVIQSTAGER